jgi:hypothetical protein
VIFSAARCHSVDTYVRGCDHSAIAVVVVGGQNRLGERCRAKPAVCFSTVTTYWTNHAFERGESSVPSYPEHGSDDCSGQKFHV